MILACLCFIITSFIKTKSSFIKTANFVCLNMALMFSAWILCYCNDVKNDKLWFGKNLYADAYVARIIDNPAEKERTWKVPVQVVGSITNKKWNPAKGKAFVYVFKDDTFLLSQGDTVLLPANWQPIKNAGNPFEFDYAAYSARNNLLYLQFLSDNEITLYAKGNATQYSWINKAHQWCLLQLEKYIKDSSARGLMQAMVVGDEANLDTDLRQAYSETGIIHIIAISGSHLTIFFLVIAFLLSWIKNKKYHWLKYIIALPLIWAYVLIAGAPPSAVRSALMFSLLALGFAFQKSNNSLNQLFATAFVLLCIQPMWLFSVGFQLSFLAVLSLILFYKPVFKRFSPVNPIVKILWGTIAASIAAEILVAPLVIYYFHLFPLLFIVANVAAYLFAGLTLVLGMLIIVFSSIAPVAGFIGIITTWLVTHFNQLVFILQQFNPTSFKFLDLKSYELVLLYIIIAGLLISILQKKKAALFTALITLCILLTSFCYNEWITLRQHKLIVYNILHANYIEEIKGRHYYVLQNDTNSKKNYVLKPSHTGMHSWREAATIANNEILKVGHNSVLILNAPPKNTEHFPVDYVIVNYNTGKPNPAVLKQVFNPKKIILGSNHSRKQAEKWTFACEAAGIPLHATIYNGAFVINSMPVAGNAFEALP
jgi:competence protein ComEC